MKRYDILGCPCEAYTAREEVFAHFDRIFAGNAGYSVAINAEKIMKSKKEPGLLESIRHAAILIPDGIGATWGLKWLHGVHSKKIDFPVLLMEYSDLKRKKVFILGGTAENNALACEKIAQNYPNLTIVAQKDGYASDDEFIDLIRQSGADVVLTGLGSPKQELFVSKAAAQLPGIFFGCCGGAINIFSGRVKRAPSWIIKSNLEWLYRFRPARFRRYMVLPVFVWLLFSAKIKRSHS